MIKIKYRFWYLLLSVVLVTGMAFMKDDVGLHATDGRNGPMVMVINSVRQSHNTDICTQKMIGQNNFICSIENIREAAQRIPIKSINLLPVIKLIELGIKLYATLREDRIKLKSILESLS